MNRQALDDLKRQVSLLEYLQAHHWQPARPIGFGRFLGLCPLHADHHPSLLVDPNKNLFYCYGCRRGGDIIRFVELYHQVNFLQAVALLHQWRGLAPLLSQVVSLCRLQLHRHSEAVAYLFERGLRSPELIEAMRIGYAPGGCLRGWLTQLGYPLAVLRQAGLVTAAGYDSFVNRVVYTNSEVTDLAFEASRNFATTARYHPLFQDFRQHSIMECVSLLRGEWRRNGEVCDGPRALHAGRRVGPDLPPPGGPLHA